MTRTQIGQSEHRALRVAVVGAGPSGYYAVAALLDAPGLHVRVDVFDRLPAPFGLVRYGVAPDHQKIKLVSRVFEKAAMDPRARFFGNVELGRDLSRDDLTRLYDAVIYAVGSQSDRRLGIPGEDLEGSWSSTEFVAWYNGHPDFAAADYPLDHRQVAVVGIGNVAMDCARLLARRAEELAETDISDPALEAFRRSRVTDVWILARRGPAQAACSPQELKEIGELEDVDVLIDAAQLGEPETAGELDRQAAKNLEIFRQLAERGDRGMARRIRFRFLASPVEVLGEDGRITGLVVERNELRPGADGTLRPAGTGETEVLPVTAVIRAIGYRALPLPGVPFDERNAVIPNRQGRVVNPRSGRELPREYVVGWAKRGPTGLIGTNKPDSQETVATLLADLAAAGDAMAAPAAGSGSGPGSRSGPVPVAELLDERGVAYVDYEAWQCIDREETRRGEASGRPRVKLCRIEEMLAAVAAERQPVADG